MRYPKLKAELKELAKEIKEWKHKRDHWYDYDTVQWKFQYKVMRRAREFRHKHIAYCLLNGTPYKLIEQPRENNKPDMIYVQMIMEEYEKPKAEFRAV